ncbi:hypothetical protein [Pseudoflavonifractor sp. 524-17]|uniref:hypothetical protein n=1 Tax=Pseudoflavonifractor sp. 524-17 TaxID=2304577 RepID=UPI00137A8CAE|nr:hypothetical protein [Pseudoflavonifractor sp. 524-17]
MNNTIHLNYLTRMSESFLKSGAVQRSTAQDSRFLSLTAQLRTEQAVPAGRAREAADMSLEAYKQSIWEKISALPMSASSQMQSISIQITDAGFEAMKNDPEYEAWVLDTLAQDFRFENPWTSVCGGGYVVHHFGATKEQYHGESWYPGYMGNQGAAMFEDKAKGSFWEQRMERHKKYMELAEEAAAKRRLMMKLRMNGGSVSAAELLMGLL